MHAGVNDDDIDVEEVEAVARQALLTLSQDTEEVPEDFFAAKDTRKKRSSAPRTKGKEATKAQLAAAGVQGAAQGPSAHGGCRKRQGVGGHARDSNGWLAPLPGSTARGAGQIPNKRRSKGAVAAGSVAQANNSLVVSEEEALQARVMLESDTSSCADAKATLVRTYPCAWSEFCA